MAIDVTNVTDIAGMFSYLDTALTSSGVRIFGIGILILIFFVTFLSARRVTAEKSLIFSSFLTMISAIILRTMELISDGTMFTCVIIFVGAFVYMLLERDSESLY